MTGVAEHGALAGAVPQVVVELAHSEREARVAVDTLAEVWLGPGGQKPLPAELVWVFAHSGNYVAVARADGGAVGAAIGFRGVDAEGPYLHSHIAGVLPGWQGANIGYSLKQHQRSWALRAGLTRITWTFDPLVTRNAYFNVVKLGAEITGYHVDFYGRMDDGVNTGDETDRCVVTWRLASARAGAAASVAPAPVDIGELRRRGAREVLRPDAAGAPRPITDESGSAGAEVRLLRLPVDAVALRRSDPARALEWRLALRDVLVPAFADGYAVVGVTRDSWYVLARPTG
jgi:predicted GNAT superfamily acetyltransferase